MNQIILSSIGKDELVRILTGVVEDVFQKNRVKEQQKIIVNEELGDYLTIKEVLKLCKINSESTLWNWRQKGLLIPKRKSGRKPLFLRQDIEDFLNNKLTQSQ